MQPCKLWSLNLAKWEKTPVWVDNGCEGALNNHMYTKIWTAYEQFIGVIRLFMIFNANDISYTSIEGKR